MNLRRKLSEFSLILLLFCSPTLPHAAAGKPENSPQPASFNGPITAAQVQPHVRFLADPRLEGRGDERSKRLAREYLIKQYAELRTETALRRRQLSAADPRSRYR